MYFHTSLVLFILVLIVINLVTYAVLLKNGYIEQPVFKTKKWNTYNKNNVPYGASLNKRQLHDLKNYIKRK